MSQLKIKNGNSWESIPAGGVGVPSGGTAGQILAKSSSTDYATEWKSIGINLLWTNPSPTSDFAQQTVQVDLSNCKCALVDLIETKAAQGRRVSFLAMVGDEVTFATILAQTNNIAMLRRVSTINSNSISFGTGQIQNASGSLSDDNSRLVPYQIYGIRT